MRVHLIKKQTIEDFVERHSRSRVSLADWLTKVKFADWNRPGDIKRTFGSADLLGRGSSRVVFDVAGNHYRMICKYMFGVKQVHLFVCWIGTHSDYDALLKDNAQYLINHR